MVYKVFIVEDEAAIRNRIKNWTFWNEGKFCLVGDAGDGEIALKRIQNNLPDILLTDIRMPFMDGLELARQIKLRYPQVHIVLLSGYNDFEYARQAIKIGVDEYVMKPITPDKLRQVLNEIAENLRIEQIKEVQDIQSQSVREGLQTNAEMWFAYALCHGQLDTDMAIKKAKEEYHLDLLAQYYCVIRLCGDVKEELLQATSTMRFRREDGTYCCILMEKSVRRIDEKLTALEEECHRQLVHLLVGSIQNKITGIARSYQEITSTENTHQIISGDLMQFDRECVTDFLQSGTVDQVEAFIAPFGANETFHSNLFRYFIMTSVMAEATSFIHQLEGQPKEVLSESFSLDAARLQQLDEWETLDFIRRILKKTVQYRDSANSRVSTVQKSLYYIGEHLSKCDLSLNEVAEYVGWSPNYFSSQFKKAVGVNFVKFVTEKRLEQAKQLLQTSNKPICEIAELVGFGTVPYFNTVFKRNLSITPNDYRLTQVHSADEIVK